MRSHVLFLYASIIFHASFIFTTLRSLANSLNKDPMKMKHSTVVALIRVIRITILAKKTSRRWPINVLQTKRGLKGGQEKKEGIKEKRFDAC